MVKVKNIEDILKALKEMEAIIYIIKVKYLDDEDYLMYSMPILENNILHIGQNAYEKENIQYISVQTLENNQTIEYSYQIVK